MFSTEMPAGAQAPFQINNQPTPSGVLTGLSWDEAAEAYWAMQSSFPSITDATGQTIEYFPPTQGKPQGYFNFTEGDGRPHAMCGYSDQFDQGGYYAG